MSFRISDHGSTKRIEVGCAPDHAPSRPASIEAPPTPRSKFHPYLQLSFDTDAGMIPALPLALDGHTVTGKRFKHTVGKTSAVSHASYFHTAGESAVENLLSLFTPPAEPTECDEVGEALREDVRSLQFEGMYVGVFPLMRAVLFAP